MPTISTGLSLHVSGSVGAEMGAHVTGTETPVSILQVSIADNLVAGASANFTKDSHLLEATFYVQNTATEIFYASKIVGTASAELLYRDQVLGYTLFSSSNAMNDGTIRVFFLNPAHESDLSVRFSATISGIGFRQFTIDVVTDAEHEAPLSDNTHHQTDPKEPRTEESTYQVFETELEQAPNESVVIDQEADIFLFRFDPTIEFDYLIKGSDILYAGGGNRFLPSLDEGELMLQQEDVIPGDVGLRAFIEGAITNLIPNPDFLLDTDVDGVPDNVTMTFPASTVDARATLISFIDDANQLKIAAQGLGNNYQGASTVRLESDTISINPGLPVSLSVLSRTSISRGEVADLTLGISWRNAGDTEITTTEVLFTPEDLQLSQMLQLDNLIDVGTIPAGTTGVRWFLELSSIDGSDSITAYFALPQIEQNPMSSSRSIGARLADDYSVEQEGHFEPERGTVTITYAPGYDSAPPEDVVLFDTRDDSGLNGYVFLHKTDGTLEFQVFDGAAQEAAVTTDNVVTLLEGAPVTLSVAWDTALVKISKDNSVLKNDTPAYTTAPTNEYLKIGSTYNGTNHLSGELQYFEVRRDVT